MWRWTVNLTLAATMVAVAACASRGESTTVDASPSTDSAFGSAAAPPRLIAQDVYDADFEARVQASRNPEHANLSWIAAYEKGRARARSERTFSYLKTHHIAYRGTPPRLTDEFRRSPSRTEVLLRVCLMRQRVGPWLPYDVTTGKDLRIGSQMDVFPSYPVIVRIAESGAQSEWSITSFRRDPDSGC